MTIIMYTQWLNLWIVVVGLLRMRKLLHWHQYIHHCTMVVWNMIVLTMVQGVLRTTVFHSPKTLGITSFLCMINTERDMNTRHDTANIVHLYFCLFCVEIIRSPVVCEVIKATSIKIAFRQH